MTAGAPGPVVAALVEALRELARRAPDLARSARTWLGGDVPGDDVVDHVVARLLEGLAAAERGGWRDLDRISASLGAWATGAERPDDPAVNALLGCIESLAATVGEIVAGAWKGDTIDPRLEAAVHSGLERLSALCLDIALGDLKRRA